MRRALILVTLGLALSMSTGASASLLCRTRKKTLVVRDVCKRTEQAVTPTQQNELGMRGPTGGPGPGGPGVRDLKVTDAAGREVGVVTSLSSYYGTATVVGALSVPGATDLPFWVFTVGPQGVDTRSATCTSSQFQYFVASDCTGAPYATCDYGACSSVSGAFLAQPLYGRDAGTACYAGDVGEFRHGDFYQRIVARGTTALEAAERCQMRGGRLLETPTPCTDRKPAPYCAPCCRLARGVGVSPVHTVDSSVIGTPPFRMTR